MNQVNLIGRMTNSAELRSTTNGTNVATFTIAVDGYTNVNGEKHTDFINCVAYSKVAEFICKYFTKGQQIAISGRINTRSYEKDGNKRYITEVITDKVYFCGKKEMSNTTETNKEEDEVYDFSQDIDDSTLPF